MLTASKLYSTILDLKYLNYELKVFRDQLFSPHEHPILCRGQFNS